MSHERRPLIYLIGIGMGGEEQLTGQAIDCLTASQAVMGAERMLKGVFPYTEGKPVLSSYRPSEMVQWLYGMSWDEAALVLSGDTGFYSGAQAAADAFEAEGWDVAYVPGISSLSYFCARLGKNWQDVHTLSLHGRDGDVPSFIRQYKNTFILLGGQLTLGALCRILVSSGLGQVFVSAGENFSYDNERIIWNMTPAELIMEDESNPFGGLACVLVENPQAQEGALYPEPMPSDRDFIRGRVPMTKETVRRLVLEKLRIGDGAICVDIGAGTGSVAVEMGLALRKRCSGGQVYAIEKKQEALELIEANVRKFHGHWEGFHIIGGEAPQALEGIEAPTHAFIGGSGGRMRAIISRLLQMNPSVRIAATAISLETVSELLSCMEGFGFQETELLQVMAAPVELLGGYHMPMAQNPVYIALMQYPREEEEELTWQEL